MHEPDRHELNAGWTLPNTYGIDRLVLLPKDPHWLFAYWEVTAELESNFRRQYGTSWETGRLVLRIHDLEAGGYKVIEFNCGADSNYLQVDEADRAYYAEMGRILPDGKFISMLTSNVIRTPRNSISAAIDPSWKMFAFWQQRRFFSGGISSFEFQSGVSMAELFTQGIEEEK